MNTDHSYDEVIETPDGAMVKDTTRGRGIMNRLKDDGSAWILIIAISVYGLFLGRTLGGRKIWILLNLVAWLV